MLWLESMLIVVSNPTNIKCGCKFLLVWSVLERKPKFLQRLWQLFVLNVLMDFVQSSSLSYLEFESSTNFAKGSGGQHFCDIIIRLGLGGS